MKDARRKTRLSLRDLGSIVEEVNATRDLDTLLRIVVSRICNAMQVDACSIYLTGAADGRHTLSATLGLRDAAVGEVTLGPDEGLVGLVASQLKPVNLADCSRHARFKFVPTVGEETFHAFLGVPVIFHGKLLGVLIVQNRQPRRFTESNVSFLVTLAIQLAGRVEFAKVTTAVTRARTLKENDWLGGVAAAPGIAIGTAIVLYEFAETYSVPDRETRDSAEEEKTFLQVVEQVRHELENLARQAGDSDHASLLDAYAMIVTSEELVGGTVKRISQGAWAPSAFKSTLEELAATFDVMEDLYLRERGRDIRDLGKRIMTKLMSSDHSEIEYPRDLVLLGQDVSAIDLMRAPRDRLRAVISEHGSAFSHLAIIARALGIPAVTGLGDLPLAELDRRELIVDGYRGRVYVNPNQALRRQFARLSKEERELAEFLEEMRDLPAVTADGKAVGVLVNAGLPGDLPLAMGAGAQGVGLYRTELLFMAGQSFPTEQQQLRVYRQLLEGFAPDRVTLRTLDIGGDKQLPYMPIVEPNPALGWRGIRVSLDQPEVLHTQLRAMLRADEGLSNAQLLLPMLTSVAELDQALVHIDSVLEKLHQEGVNVTRPPIGVMIEVPSAVYQADLLAQRADFLSVGTNDLTQYLLAVDRNNERVAGLFDTLHPAVLQAIYNVVQCGARHAKPVSICGEIAADPAAVILLVGMGSASLSVNAGDVSRVKWVIRNINADHSRELVQRALAMQSPVAIREMLTQVLDEAGLGGLVRPGRV